ncbi:uncharacterized protein PV06_10837 [Exophiala oligosperma]|uniref:ABM domain-containing protein n=1 Tax=Exophiala oligosperma TaxID=215243 RepID=A0A0D2DMJ3_9EURO|nr:uncharacterized protein PV06_10837 [Exophiala oligosperma]KIW36934.1 hypothetical protein PV06_10837 [Exophiala oligosperma]
MSKLPSELLCEVICPRAKTGEKDNIISTFKKVFEISTESAAAEGSEPPFGLRVFDNVEGQPEEAGLFLFWRSIAHHDGLSQTPGFAPAAQMVGDKITPNLETPLQPYYLWTRQVDVALLEAPCCEVIEIKVQDSSVNAVQFEEAMNKVFDSLKLPRGFLGVFYGPQHENPGTFILVTKWEGSKGVVNNDSWLRESEESLQSMFGGKARIQSRRQMYS